MALGPSSGDDRNMDEVVCNTTFNGCPGKNLVEVSVANSTPLSCLRFIALSKEKDEVVDMARPECAVPTLAISISSATLPEHMVATSLLTDDALTEIDSIPAMSY